MTENRKESYLEEIRRDLAENPPEKPTLEEFKDMVRKDRAARRKKHTAIIAACVAFLVVGFFAFDLFAPDVDADKNPKEEIVTEDGVIIEDGGWGSSEEEDNVWVTEDWEQVKDAKLAVPNICIPRYIPDGYGFEKLMIEKVETGAVTCEYFFMNSESEEIEIEVFIYNGGAVRTQISEYTSTIQCNRGLIYLQEGEKKATIQTDDGKVISIWGCTSENDIIKIVDNLEY